ncbi:MAG: Asp23/Gls24 family envelope stress response protein [Coriobacteriia bacterium]|nr:Asp23/Gls24 family envelope stress response protein [Coriobacteriia bacterium]
MSNVPGNLIITDDVISRVAGHAAGSVYGVVGMAAPSTEAGLAKLLPVRRSHNGVVVETTEGQTRVDLYVVLEHGVNINTVSENLVEAMSFALKGLVQGALVVEVHVQAIQVR